MPKFSEELASLLTDYMDAWKPASAAFMQLLDSTEPDMRYALLMTVRGTKINDTGVTVAAYIHDLECLKSMFEGLTPKQKYDILKLTNGYGATPPLSAVWNKGSYDTAYSTIEVLDYLLSDLSAELQFDILKMKNTGGNTAIHVAVRFSNPLVIQRILVDLSSDQKERLLAMKNKKDTTAADKSVPALFRAVQDIEVINQRLAALEGSNEELKERNAVLERERHEMTQFMQKMSEQLHQLSVQVNSLRAVDEMPGVSTMK
ncbi:uncharacterized protein [Watersipora subatra]|uniref:uncharacterized protein n=1 Tax=Watersipora subatra TaxID=2589382 RepID=UPI00355B8D44